MLAYKVLNGGRSLFTATAWPRPRDDQPGDWLEVDGELGLCRNGIHACSGAQLPLWLGDELWALELDGEVITTPTTLVARRARLLSRVERWDATARTCFAADCVERATGLAGGRADLRDVLDVVETFAKLQIVASVAYWAAVLAGDSVAADRSGPAYDEAFSRERAAQARWLRDELMLAG